MIIRACSQTSILHFPLRFFEPREQFVRPFYGFLVVQARQQLNGGDVPVFRTTRISPSSLRGRRYDFAPIYPWRTANRAFRPLAHRLRQWWDETASRTGRGGRRVVIIVVATRRGANPPQPP
jgi:hypothetical protein